MSRLIPRLPAVIADGIAAHQHNIRVFLLLYGLQHLQVGFTHRLILVLHTIIYMKIGKGSDGEKRLFPVLFFIRRIRLLFPLAGYMVNLKLAGRRRRSRLPAATHGVGVAHPVGLPVDFAGDHQVAGIGFHQV